MLARTHSTRHPLAKKPATRVRPVLLRQRYDNYFTTTINTTTVVRGTPEVALEATIPSNTLTNKDMSEGLEGKDGIALIAFGQNRVILSVVRGVVKAIDVYSTGSDALGNLIVDGQWAQLTTGTTSLEYRVTFTPA